MIKISLAFAFTIVQFSVFAQDQKTVFVVDSIMDAYMRSGYANDHFWPKGKYDKQKLKTGKWRDYEVDFDQVFLIDSRMPILKSGTYLMYGKGLYEKDLKLGEWEMFVLEDKTFDKFHFKTVNYLDGKQEGTETYYYPSGKVAAVGEFIGDDPNGEFIQYFEDGSFYAISNYANAKLNGKQIVYYPSGQTLSEKIYINDSVHGLVTYYYSDGQTNYSANYNMGVENGSYKYFRENGQLWTEKIRVDGLLISVTTFSETGEELDNGTLENGN